MQTAIYTIPHYRLTKKKDIPSSGITLDIHVRSLEELNSIEKKEEIEKIFKDFKKGLGLVYFLSLESFSLPKPVYIRKNELGEEVLVYNSNIMELNKLYEIEWEGEKWALKKTEKEIEFQKWESENKEEGNE